MPPIFFGSALQVIGPLAATVGIITLILIVAWWLQRKGRKEAEWEAAVKRAEQAARAAEDTRRLEHEEHTRPRDGPDIPGARVRRPDRDKGIGLPDPPQRP